MEKGMPTAIPGAKPRLSSEKLRELLSPFAVDRIAHPVVVVGVRGYYRDSMGAPNVNDRGIYDDAIFLDTPSGTVAYNANTDPSRYRKGSGRGLKKGMASLKPGAWYVHHLDLHRGKYLALCQRLGSVTVVRDGVDHDYEDTGYFGINIHRGSVNSTSSIGCQTIVPDQWSSFIGNIKDQALRYFGDDKYKSTVIPYVLIENP